MEDSSTDLIPSRQVQFWTILVFEIPSLACTIYLFYHIIVNKKLRQALHNHVIIILLFLSFIINIIDQPFYLDAYLHNGKNSFQSSPIICLIWLYVDYGFYGAITVFFAWASFERHILIFYYNQCLRTKMKRMIFHYIPLIVLSIYMIGFYIGVIIFPPCENSFDYEIEACGMSPCYEEISWLNIWDYLINGAMCTLIEAICSISLLIRVLWKRHRAHQPIHWKKHRKMTIQLLSISTLSLTTTLPQTLITAVQQIIPGMTDFAYEVEPYFFYLTTFVVLLLPFVTLGCFPELWPNVVFFKIRQHIVVVPITTTPARLQFNSTRRQAVFQ